MPRRILSPSDVRWYVDWLQTVDVGAHYFDENYPDEFTPDGWPEAPPKAGVQHDTKDSLSRSEVAVRLYIEKQHDPSTWAKPHRPLPGITVETASPAV